MGVDNAEDSQFHTQWRVIFLQPAYRYLHVPWRMVLGNHDYMGEPEAQIAHH
jgi:hypothetical protein